MIDNGFWKVCEALDSPSRLELLRHLMDIEKTAFPCVPDGRRAVSVAYSPSGFPLSLKDDFSSVSLAYDRYGRLTEISSFGTSVKYRYDAKGRIARQTVDGNFWGQSPNGTVTWRIEVMTANGSVEGHESVPVGDSKKQRRYICTIKP